MLIAFLTRPRETMKLRQAEQPAQAQAAEAAQQQNALDALAGALAGLAEGDLTFRVSSRSPPHSRRARRLQRSLEAGGALTAIAGTLSIMAGSEEVSQPRTICRGRSKSRPRTWKRPGAAREESRDAENLGRDAEARNVVTRAKGRQAFRRGRRRQRDTIDASRVVRANQPHHRRDRRDRLPDQPFGPECGRRGGAGGRRRRGFAVVATEVRALAQRSAEAAKEIKTLISTSGAQVELGVKLVNDTGKTLGEIVEQVNRLNALVTDIAASAQEEATALGQVNTAVSQMDRTTQQNAAMVEEASAASRETAGEAQQLHHLVGQFRLDGTPAHEAPPKSATSTPSATAPRGRAAA